MDELDIKIMRALIAESAIAPTTTQVRTSLREIAKKLGSDDMTVRNRYKKFEEVGLLSFWRLVVNPSLFDYKGVGVVVDVEPEYAKADMKRKLRLLDGVVSMVDYYGKRLRMILLYDGDESRSRTVELISRITNAEKVTLHPMPMPRSETKHLTETDMAIIRALATNARKPCAEVAKELGFSTRTVKHRIDRLCRERTLFAYAEVGIEDVPGLTVVDVEYTYARNDLKDSVDRSVLAHFDSNYVWGQFWDPEYALIHLNAPNIAGAQRFLDWAKEQPGVASARLDIAVECAGFPEKLGALLTRRPEQLAAQENR